MPFLFPSTTLSSSTSFARNNVAASSSTSIPSVSSTTARLSKSSTSTLIFSFPVPSYRPPLAANMQMPSIGVVVPQTADILSTKASMTPSAPTSMSALETGVMMPDMMLSASSSASIPAFPAQSQQAGATGTPQMFYPHEQSTIMSKGAGIAAIVLGILGLVALVLGIVVCVTRRRRRSKEIKRSLEEDAMFDPRNTKFLVTPEPTFQKPSMTSLNQQPNNINAHMTRSTDRDNYLFGAAPYARPETVTTERRNFPTPPTPNPFYDPQRSKAYDLLGGRPRSTTPTDRGSWARNPFRDPESERFDPFGELHDKAKRERARQLDEQRREAELMQEMERARKVGARHAAEALREAELVREYEEMERAPEAKEAMGLAPEGLRKQGRR